jgi:hypothetical protein
METFALAPFLQYHLLRDKPLVEIEFLFSSPLETADGAVSIPFYSKRYKYSNSISLRWERTEGGMFRLVVYAEYVHITAQEDLEWLTAHTTRLAKENVLPEFPDARMVLRTNGNTVSVQSRCDIKFTSPTQIANVQKDPKSDFGEQLFDTVLLKLMVQASADRVGFAVINGLYRTLIAERAKVPLPEAVAAFSLHISTPPQNQTSNRAMRRPLRRNLFVDFLL